VESEGSSDNSDQKFPNKHKLMTSCQTTKYSAHLNRTRDARKAPVYCAVTDKMPQRPCNKPIAAYIPT
jgi:hypothetical protein